MNRGAALEEPRVLDLAREAAEHQAQLGSLAASPLATAAIATWHARMVNEWTSHGVFEALAHQLDESGFEPALGRECRGFALEERRHGELCGAVVQALGGRARARLPTRARFPLHSDAPPRAAVLRNVVSICCMSETVAVALIGAERLEMPDGPLHDLLTRIWADEVGHARFGWRLLETIGDSLTAPEREAVSAYLPTAFDHLLAHELAHLPELSPPPGGEALGLCSGSDARALLSETVTCVIRPGLARWFAISP